MVTSEIFSKCVPHTTSTTPGVGGIPSLTWEDVLRTISGIEKKHEGFIRYIYLDDPKGHADFFAGLMMETCSRSDIQHWRASSEKHQGHLESLVLFAIREWKHGQSHKYTDDTRAIAYGVTRWTWVKHFRQTYSVIVGAPAYWESKVLETVKKRLYG